MVCAELLSDVFARMSTQAAAPATCLAVTACLVLSIHFLRHTKFAEAPRVRAITVGDVLLSVLSGCIPLLLAGISPTLAWIASFACLLIWLALWLDTALYGCFSFELGMTGITEVVFTTLLREIWSVRYARQFLLDLPLFVLLPILWLLLLIPIDPHLRWPIACGALLLLLFGGGLPETLEIFDHSERSDRRRALAIDLVRSRSPRIPPDFVVRDAHRNLLHPKLTATGESALHGRLKDASVLLLTFESLGQVHLAEDGAVTPFLRALADSEHSISSAYHLTPAPLTNAAHAALYLDRYLPRARSAREGLLHTLRAAKYQTIYLTAANTGHYGLRPLIEEAGFSHVMDADTLRPETPIPFAPVADSALCRVALPKLQALLQKQSGPVFLHVHASNAHIPYLVENRLRFARHDHRDDRGRFLCAIEETDALFAQLREHLTVLLRSLSPTAEEPLVIVSSDHGQSFGNMGYFSHGTAVTSEQTWVPFHMHHPKLPRRLLPCSTHFDVLPTVMDLLGLASGAALGQSLLLDEYAMTPLLFDGQTSRDSTGCLGIVLPEGKFALDLARDTLIRTDREDRQPVALEGEERAYYEALIGAVARQRGVLCP